MEDTELIKEILENGSILYYDKDGLSHRDNDLPAICSKDGSVREWYQYGICHRENGPACIHESKNIWFYNGKRHREDGPAFENILTGAKSWFIHGTRHREDGPALIEDGDHTWYLNGLIHREDGPAIINRNGTMYWYKHGKQHREDGPSVMAKDGIIPKTEFYHLNGLSVSKIKWLKEITTSVQQQLLQLLSINDSINLQDMNTISSDLHNFLKLSKLELITMNCKNDDTTLSITELGKQLVNFLNKE